jgi:hypothetical protein
MPIAGMVFHSWKLPCRRRKIFNNNRSAEGLRRASQRSARIMASKEIVHLSEDDLRRFLSSMGPPPVLSTEDPKAFGELFFNVARSRKASDLLSLSLVWEITVDTWENRRYVRHSAIAIDRWWQRTNEQRLKVSMEMKATYEGMFRKKEKGLSTYPSDAAEAAKLQERIDNTVKEIDAIAAYVPTEVDFNRGLQINADLLHDLDQFRNGANRRRLGNYMLLDKHNANLNRAMQQGDKVVDAEFEEVQAETEDQVQGTPPAITVAPSIVPAENEKSNDVEPQDRSQSA